MKILKNKLEQMIQEEIKKSLKESSNSLKNLSSKYRTFILTLQNTLQEANISIGDESIMKYFGIIEDAYHDLYAIIDEKLSL